MESLNTNMNINSTSTTKEVQEVINRAAKLKHPDLEFNIEDLSDGYHTFKELYEFRKLYNAALFNEWAKNWKSYQDRSAAGVRHLLDAELPKYDVHKSWKHYDGEWCFGEEKKWFIVVAILPTGQISNHYKAEDWDLFKIPEVEKAKYEFDSHTPQDVLDRLKQL